MEPYLIVLEPGATGYVAFSPDVPGCVATGPDDEQTLAEMRAALAFHFEGIVEAKELIPLPKGIERYIDKGEFCTWKGNLIATVPAEELLATISVPVPAA